MKILHVIPALNQANGGPPRGLATLAKAQAERGDNVVVFPCRTDHGPQTLDPGRFGNLFVHEPATDSRLLWYHPKFKRLLRNAARDREILHIHGSWRYHLIGAASIASAYGIPYIIRPAGNLGHVTRRRKAFLKMPYFWLFERSIFNRAAAIHCCSNKELQELTGLKLRTRRFIVPQPIRSDLTKISPDFDQLTSRCPHLKNDDRVILYLGRFSAVKRLEILLEAFVRLSSLYPNWHLILAGPHGDMDIVHRLEQRAQRAGISNRVSMPGLAENGMKAACFARAEIFAQPSAHENFGLSVAEALLFRIPCVVSDGVALSDDIAEKKAGIVCKSTVKSYEQSLRVMFSGEAARREFSKAAGELACRFAPARVVQQLNVEYQICLSEKR